MAQGGLNAVLIRALGGLALGSGVASGLGGAAAAPLAPQIPPVVAPSSAAPPSPLLPAVRFVPGSLLLPPPGPRPVLRDTCGAAALAWLVGQPRSRIPIPVDLSHRRVSCTACVVASDVRLDRLNILYDARTDRVARVTCG